VLAAALVYWSFQRGAGALPLAALLTAAMLAAPHASNSDGVLLALATSLYATASRPGALGGARAALAAAVWISPLINPPALFRIGAIAPLLILLLVAAIVAEQREEAYA
jgi:hypothetical protein